jgi:hypothetical protein
MEVSCTVSFAPCSRVGTELQTKSQRKPKM